MLREITGKRLRTRRVPVLRCHGRPYYRTQKTFEVFLACKHVVEVPFGRRPQVGRSMTCRTCAPPLCAVCEKEAGTIKALWDDRDVEVCPGCYEYETGEKPKGN